MRAHASSFAAILSFAFTPPAFAEERRHETVVVIPAAAPVVWDALTTAEGWKRMGVGMARVDFRVGGTIETSYDAKAKPGDPDNITSVVVAYLPGRMMALRNTKAPPNFPYAKEFATTVTVFEIAPVDASSTRVTATGVGYREGPAYDWLIKMFSEGNRWSLDQLAKSLAASAKPVDGQ
ncbi:Uncharacterized conserved protein YndB, AHSA1/START domain [Allosphingosinicella indica]|uniref:Uncharacterized conserved protein YndB, AHSA1/START domain n=2 Tax=Allosphingosinicella indica TaxID=941907 RepID=A0A1X7G2X2_9SPHN|nr:Uncharacterized conserved protein YndB, AHSA1/START domain [Allosphingosinicella indica]